MCRKVNREFSSSAFLLTYVGDETNNCMDGILSSSNGESDLIMTEHGA